MDPALIQNGVIVKTLSKAQREVIKDKFKAFNTDIEEMYKHQKSWTIPDADLRMSLLKEIKNVLLVLYVRFYERYQTLEFSKNPTKYIRYDKEQLDEMLNEFFLGYFLVKSFDSLAQNPTAKYAPLHSFGL